MRGRFAISDSSSSSISQNTPPVVHLTLPGKRLEVQPKTPTNQQCRTPRRVKPGEAPKSPKTPRNIGNHQPVIRQATPRPPPNTRAQILGNGFDTPTQLPVNQYRY